MTATLAPIIDMHTHLVGIGQNGTGCYIAPKKFDSMLYRMLRQQLGIYDSHKQQRLDAAYCERLDRDVAAATTHKTLDAVVLFAHDRIHTDHGDPDLSRLELYVPNDYVLATCERPEMRGRFLPAVSVHPYRVDAIAEVERCIERGAVALKWLPNSQNIDPQDPRCLRIYELLARHRVPLIAHTGGEHVVSICNSHLGDPRPLRAALDRGVTVVAAHCATKSGLFDPNWLPEFLNMSRQYANFWGDTSAFCSPGRARWIKRILLETNPTEKLVHGSDYPVPPVAWTLMLQLGWRKTKALHGIWSFLERDIQIKRELGMPDAVFRNAARILRPGSLERWQVCVNENTASK